MEYRKGEGGGRWSSEGRVGQCGVEERRGRGSME